MERSFYAGATNFRDLFCLDCENEVCDNARACELRRRARCARAGLPTFFLYSPAFRTSQALWGRVGEWTGDGEPSREVQRTAILQNGSVFYRANLIYVAGPHDEVPSHDDDSGEISIPSYDFGSFGGDESASSARSPSLVPTIAGRHDPSVDSASHNPIHLEEERWESAESIPNESELFQHGAGEIDDDDELLNFPIYDVLYEGLTPAEYWQRQASRKKDNRQ